MAKREIGGARQLIVRSRGAAQRCGVLFLGMLTVPCALGRGGITAFKREGDGATPRGRFDLRRVLYRSGQAPRPRTRLPIAQIKRDDGWCDAPPDRNYNRAVRHPYPTGAEVMWRDDGLYDVVVVIGYNDRPRIRGRGSAIFLHVVKPGFEATEGCVAVRASDMRKLLAYVGRGSRIVIGM